MNTSEVRPALYYPYIHIRSEHWLKATLLCAPAVKRIVPDSYTPQDSSRIRRYVEISGPFGELLQSVPANSAAAANAQKRLLMKLRRNKTAITRRFNRKRSPAKDKYWIHDAKFSERLLRYLENNNLAWWSHDPYAVGQRSWYALHPTLGSAIMTTLGLSIAEERGYDIVTPSATAHETLLAAREDAIFDELLKSERERTFTSTQAQHELGQLVIAMTDLNFEALRPEDIPELQASEHFYEFQQLIRSKARTIERREGGGVYREQLKDTAEEIVEIWRGTQRDVSRSIKRALVAASGPAAAEAARYSMQGAVDSFNAGSVAVGVVLAAGMTLWPRRRGPYRYLTQVTGRQDKTLRMTFPLGLER